LLSCCFPEIEISSTPSWSSGWPKVAGFKDPAVGSRKKDALLLELLDGARQAVRGAKHVTQDHDSHEVMQDETE
jgi:hypothetical protein